MGTVSFVQPVTSWTGHRTATACTGTSPAHLCALATAAAAAAAAAATLLRGVVSCYLPCLPRAARRQDRSDFFSTFCCVNEDGDEEEFDDYLGRMRENGEWAGQPEVIAMAHAAHVDIMIYQVGIPGKQDYCSNVCMCALINPLHAAYASLYHARRRFEWSHHSYQPPWYVWCRRTIRTKFRSRATLLRRRRRAL